jgi:hypothetical protein
VAIAFAISCQLASWGDANLSQLIPIPFLFLSIPEWVMKQYAPRTVFDHRLREKIATG